MAVSQSDISDVDVRNAVSEISFFATMKYDFLQTLLPNSHGEQVFVQNRSTMP